MTATTRAAALVDALPVHASAPVRAIHSAGGRALIVGGWVRDALLGRPSKDVDIEVYGLDVDALQRVLASLGEVIEVGRAFGVLRVKGLDIDFSLPRRDSKRGPGHRGFDVEPDPHLDYATAFRRRDLTVNSLGLDPVDGTLVDPHGGLGDLDAGVLRATDPNTFSEDPLRGLRAAQFAARLDMRADAELKRVCADLSLDELAPERLGEEWHKLLLKGTRPSTGLELLRETGLLRFFPQLAALVDVPQDPRWHPEGDVWIHTGMVVDEAAALRDGAHDDDALMFGALCHDFGKPLSTYTDDKGRVRSPGHDVAGCPPTREFLDALRASGSLMTRVDALVRYHLAPALLDAQGASDRAYRKLARGLAQAGVTPDLLARLATADHFGRTTESALARNNESALRFVDRMAKLGVRETPPRDVVQGRDLIAAGVAPGPRMGELLARCRDIQDETGLDDAQAIIERLFASRAQRAGEKPSPARPPSQRQTLD